LIACQRLQQEKLWLTVQEKITTEEIPKTKTFENEKLLLDKLSQDSKGISLQGYTIRKKKKIKIQISFQNHSWSMVIYW